MVDSACLVHGCHNPDVNCVRSRTKFFEVDLKPVCNGCYDKFPGDLKKRLKKAYEQKPKK